MRKEKRSEWAGRKDGARRERGGTEERERVEDLEKWNIKTREREDCVGLLVW